MVGKTWQGRRAWDTVSSSEAQQQEGSKLLLDRANVVFNTSAVDKPREPGLPARTLVQPQGQLMICGLS